MKTVSPYAYASVLIIIRLFFLTVYMASSNENAAITCITAAAFSLAKLAVFILIFIILKQKNIILRLCQNRYFSKVFYIVSAVFAAAYLLSVSDLFSTLIESVYPDRFTKLGITAVLFIAFAYAASMGIKGVSRAASVSLALFLIIMTIILFGLRGNMISDRINLYTGDIAKHTMTVLGKLLAGSADFFVFFGLLPYLGRSPVKAAGLYITADILISALFFLIGASVMGNFWENSGYSFFTLSCSTQGSLIDRCDGIFLAVSTACALICGAVLFIIFKDSISYLSGIKNADVNTVYTICAAAFTAVSLSFMSFRFKPQNYLPYISAVSSAILFLICLLFAIISHFIKFSDKKKISKESS